MNIGRQYKLYKLGVEVPKIFISPIKFIEDTLDKTDLVYLEHIPRTLFFVKTNGPLEVYLEFEIKGVSFFSIKRYNNAFTAKLNDLVDLTINENKYLGSGLVICYIKNRLNKCNIPMNQSFQMEYVNPITMIGERDYFWKQPVNQKFQYISKK